VISSMLLSLDVWTASTRRPLLVKIADPYLSCRISAIRFIPGRLGLLLVGFRRVS